MASSITKYFSWRENQENGVGVIDWSVAGDTIKVMLTTNTYVPSTSHTTKANVTNEVAGSSYVARGQEILNKSVTQAVGVTTVDGSNVLWSQNAGGFTNARYAVIYKDSGVDSTSYLVGYIDLAADKANVNGDFSLEWDDAGIYITE